MSEVQEKLRAATGMEAKIRYYIEYEYAESFQFFSLFKRSGTRQDLGIERCVEISAIAY